MRASSRRRRAELAAEGFAGDRALVTRHADCRYRGQGYEVRFEVPAGPIDERWAERTIESFHLAHEREYGQRFDAEIDVVNIRVTGVGLVPELDWPEIEARAGEAEPKFEREVVFAVEGGPSACRRRSTNAPPCAAVRRSPARRSSSSTTRPQSFRRG